MHSPTLLPLKTALQGSITVITSGFEESAHAVIRRVAGKQSSVS